MTYKEWLGESHGKSLGGWLGSGATGDALGRARVMLGTCLNLGGAKPNPSNCLGKARHYLGKNIDVID
jgi:hypothetical protein